MMSYRSHVLIAVLGGVVLIAHLGTPPAAVASPQASTYTLSQVLAYPFPNDLIASPHGQRLAWVLFQRGERSIWIAEGPMFEARQLVRYREDDGQELTNLVFSGDGERLVYVRGGDHGANWPAEGNLMPNPRSLPEEPKMEIWSVTVSGGEPMLLAEGDAPAPAPSDDRVAFEKDDSIWVVPIDGRGEAKRLFFARGRSATPRWSPDGQTLAFVSDRENLGYIGLYQTAETAIRYLAPSTSRDSYPRWSPDGKKIAFVRRPGEGGPAASPLEEPLAPWSIWVADAATGEAHPVWESPQTRRGSYPRIRGGANLNWAAGNRLIFLSEVDGWPHLYSIPSTGGDARLLTPGDFMVEYVSMSADLQFVLYNANTGSDPNDIDRRHLYKVGVDGNEPQPLTSGKGIEWSPVTTAEGNVMAYFGSDAQRPPLPYVLSLDGGEARAMAAERVPEDFPASSMVTPQPVVFDAPDYLRIHSQLFKKPEGPALRPGIIFVHGGPPRQMLLGWHYMFYYANTYAVNQYLASQGYVVLSVNYRLGIGYGRDFQHPDRAGMRGASEYQDVLAGAKYLAARADVDAKRIGIWGGSYGGFLTAHALGQNSDVFAAGVDIHGVHDRRGRVEIEALQRAAATRDGITSNDLDRALRVAWESSPASWVHRWTSPVLLIHGDDDRNVDVGQTVDLVQRLRAKGVAYEEIVIPDDIHDFLLYRSWLKVSEATADFFDRMLKPTEN